MLYFKYTFNVLKEVNMELKRNKYYYENVEAMKKDLSLLEGDICTTLGYYTENDGGGSSYIIVSSGTEDCGYIHKLSNNLYAKMIVTNNSANIKQFGAKGNGSSDDTLSLKNAIQCDAFFDLLIPSGTYLYSEPINISSTLPYKYIHGSCNYNTWDKYNKSTKLIYIPSSSDSTAITISGSGIKVSDLIIQCGAFGYNTVGIHFKTQYGFFDRLTTTDFDGTSLIFSCPYSNLSLITTTFSSKMSNYISEYGLLESIAEFSPTSGATSININQLVLGSPTYCYHKKGLIIRGNTNLINNLMLPGNAITPLIFENVTSSTINNPYFEYNSFRESSSPFVLFSSNSKGCAINNGYMSGTFNYSDLGLENSCQIFALHSTTPSFISSHMLTNYVDFIIGSNSNNLPVFTDGLNTGTKVSSRFYMSEITGDIINFDSQHITFNTENNTKNICLSLRLRKTDENIKLFSGKTICFGCKYSISSDLPESSISGTVQGLNNNLYNKGQGANGIVQTIAKIPIDYFDTHNYLYFAFLLIKSNLLVYKGSISVENFFFYVVNNNVDYIPTYVEKKGDVFLGDLIFSPNSNLVLTSPNNIQWKLAIDDNGSLSVKKI